MAKHLQKFFSLTKTFSESACVHRPACSPVVTQVRWSQYSPTYMEPTVNKEELKTTLLDTDERRFHLIKAAKIDQSSSIFYDPLIEKFTNMVMKGGNKQIARDIVERTFENIKLIQLEKYHTAPEEEKASIESNPVTVFKQALNNCKPILILTRIPKGGVMYQDTQRGSPVSDNQIKLSSPLPRYKGGVMYQVPIPCPAHSQRFKSMKWIIESCRDKERKIPMEEKLSWEILDAYDNKGKSVKRKQDLHRQCEANRAYAHFRW